MNDDEDYDSVLKNGDDTDVLIHELLVRVIYLENKMERERLRIKEITDTFLKGQSNLTIRFDRLEAILAARKPDQE